MLFYQLYCSLRLPLVKLLGQLSFSIEMQICLQMMKKSFRIYHSGRVCGQNQN